MGKAISSPSGSNLPGTRRRGCALRPAVGLLAAGLALAACGAPTTALRAGAEQLPAQAGSDTPFRIGLESLLPGTGGLANLNPYNPSFQGAYIVFLPLAVQLPPKYNHYVPELASSWQATKNKITIHLRENAKWQDGKPITAKDLTGSLVLSGENGGTEWGGITGVHTSGSKTVTLSVKPTVSVDGLLAEVLGTTLVPMSQYGRFLPAHPVSAMIKQAAQTAAGRAGNPKIAALQKKLVAYAPPTVIGDGPFTYSKLTSQAFLAEKWNGFWGASNIHPAAFEHDGFATGEETYGALFAQRIDYSEIGSTEPIVKRWLKTPNSHFAVGDAFEGNAFIINTKQAPLDNVKVRQALAYLMNRPTISYAAYLGAPEAEVSQYPDGLTNTVRNLYLTSSQKAKLNPYKYSKAKATSLLESAGLTKKGSQWFLSNGKPFTLSVAAPTDLPDQVIMATVYSKDLTGFGIKSTQEGTSYPQYSTLQLGGRYDLSWTTYGDGNVAPLTQFQSTMSANNFVGSGEDGMAFGPTANVPGLGRVNIATALNDEVASVNQTTNNATTRKLVWDWSRFFNKELPFLPLADVEQPAQFSTSHFSHWPSKDSALWPLIHVNPYGGLIVAMEKGYIKPK